ncbi:hypothetical protein FH972_022354 [Carpinus fangiana]|uniref:Uncharacterized protein n=1 Tax=Carpinus fangiana TaxID=176857 RepID=A0A5N6KSP4_9ROSI|nr:hypothetical protein FH972_022354 [Carpinus fangiana]
MRAASSEMLNVCDSSILSSQQAHLHKERPEDILEADDNPRTLEADTVRPLPEPPHAWVIHPGFSLADLQQTWVLSSPRDHPIRLTDVLGPCADTADDDNSLFTSSATSVLGSYPLINPLTEAYQIPSSLIFLPDASRLSGSTFLAGATNLLAVFDIARPGQPPVEVFKTIPSTRKKSKGGGVGMKGIVSALACFDASSGPGLVAAGTWSRKIGLYSGGRALSQVALWALADDSWASPTSDVNQATGEKIDIGGSGVDKVEWSPCGRYLYVFERKSDGGLVYDVRVLGKKLGTLTGRDALTNQRMGVQVVPADLSDEFLDTEIPTDDSDHVHTWSSEAGGHHDVYTSSTAGVVNVYRNPHLKAGAINADYSIPGLHGDAIGGLSMHPQFGVLATASGQRHFDDLDSSDDSDDSGEEDTTSGTSAGKPAKKWDLSLRIWAP